MTLCAGFSPKRPIEIHTPKDIVQHELSPLAVVQRVQVVQPAEQGKGVDENVRESRIGLSKVVAGDLSLWANER